MAHIKIIFDGPPGHDSGRFVEVHDIEDKSIGVGTWRERDDRLWELDIGGVDLLEAIRADREDTADKMHQAVKDADAVQAFAVEDENLTDQHNRLFREIANTIILEPQKLGGNISDSLVLLASVTGAIADAVAGVAGEPDKAGAVADTIADTVKFRMAEKRAKDAADESCDLSGPAAG